MNSLQQNIKKQLVDPAIRGINHSVIGYVTVVYSDENKVDITYKDNNGQTRFAKKIVIPNNNDGIFKQDLEAGDIVELTYRNQKKENMFISSITKKNQSYSDLFFDKGNNVPLSTNLF